MYPSEYAYWNDSVTRSESVSANCVKYQSDLQQRVYTEQYIHCDGATRKLTDSDIGTEQYQPADYYVWIAGNNAQALFIFPIRVYLTTITL